MRPTWRLPGQLSGRRSRRSTRLVRSKSLIRYRRLRRFFLILACSRMGLNSGVPVSLVPCRERGERRPILSYWLGSRRFSHLSYPNGLPCVSLPLSSFATYCRSLASVVSSSRGSESWIAHCRCRWLVILSVTASSSVLFTITFVSVLPAVAHVVSYRPSHVQFPLLTLYSHPLYIDMVPFLYAPYLVVCALTLFLGVRASVMGSYGYGGSRARAV